MNSTEIKYNKGLLVSAFDLLHAGHMLILKDSKNICKYLVVGLHIDPSIERPTKNKPILSVEERLILLQGIKYVDEIFLYNTEAELLDKIKEIKPDVLILGSDWKDKDYTGKNLPIDVYFHNREIHSYSSSNIRKRVFEEELKKYNT